MKAVRPPDLEAALELLAERSPDDPIVPLAGGTDVLVHWPVRPEARDRDYLDLTGLAELRGVRWSDEALELGALASYWDVIADAQANEELPILVTAARQVGAIQIQSRGTWAGNIVNGSPAADGVPVLMACDAVVILASRERAREVPLDRYYTGYREGARRHDELVVAIRIPRTARPLQRFVKVGPRRAQAIAKVGLAVARSDAGWRVVAASVAPTVRRCTSVERLIDEGMPDAPEDLDAALRADVSPIDDVRSTAAYRQRVLARVLFDVLRDETRRAG
ncbi:MAG TPA: FAD binding domain-containing protein [Gemmatimonadota bacterium]|nr:FAD binding domain-containing protein [Gemmatimonadota bacterium]